MKRGRYPIFFLLCSILLSGSTVAFSETLGEWTNSVRSLCMSPDTPGKYWDVNAHADVGGGVRVKLVGEGDANAGVTFSKGEWDGIQRVLKEQQASENKNYRDCVMNIIPVLKDKINSKPGEGSEGKAGGAFLDVPLGVSRNDIKVDGKWVIYHGKTYFKYPQRFLGFDFEAFSEIKGDRVVLALLRINKSYEHTVFTTGNERQSGNKESVDSYCFEGRYQKAVSNLVQKFGAPSAPHEEDIEDRSSDAVDNAGWCSKNRAASCDKKWMVEYKRDFFDGATEKVEFTATMDYGHSLASLGDTFSSNSWSECEWIVKVSPLK